MSEQNAVNTPKRKWVRIVRVFSIVAILLVVLIVTAPWIVANSGLRDGMLNAILASPSVTATSQAASFGWFSPLSVQGLQLNNANDHIQIHVDDISAERSLLQLWSMSPDLGKITVTKPRVKLTLPLAVNLLNAERLKRLEPTFTAEVREAALEVRVPELDEPVIDVDDINMTFRVEETGTGRLLTLDPIVVFDRRKLSPRLGGKLLHLIVPTLGATPQVKGEVSLSLDKLRIPIGITREELVKGIELGGKLGLHQVTTEVKSPTSQAIAHLLAVMNGTETSDVMHIVQDAEVRFHVRDGRLFHEGLRLGFPDIDPALQVRAQGSVGLDETLDLHLELPRLDKAERKEKGTAQCQVTGTIRNPKISVQDASLVIRRPNRAEPIINAHGINLNASAEKAASGLVLVVEPVAIFTKEKLNLEVTAGLTLLIDPELRSGRKVSGEISLSLDELRIPLGVGQDQRIKELQMAGKLTLHQVATESNSALRQVVLKVIADMYGKQAPEVVRVVEDAEVRFQVRDGRLHHEGLRLGLPDIDPQLVVSSRGSVGLDETLDLHLELPRLIKDERKEKGPIQCHITGTVREPKVFAKGAALIVQMTGGDKPTLQVGNVDLTFGIEDAKEGRILTLAPVTIFAKRKLSPEMGSDLLRLVAPALNDLTEVQGVVSLSLEKFRMPLGVPKGQMIKRTELAGTLHMHEASAAVKTPLLKALVKMLADMHGKQPSEVVRVAKDTEIRFYARDGRMHQEGLRLGLPDIDPKLQVSMSGSVGLDQTLDLVLEAPRIFVNSKLVPIAASKSTAPVQLRITGTIDKPIVTEIKEVKKK